MIVARRVHQILGIRLIHHGKIRIQPDGFPVGAQQSIGNGVKGATPNGSERAASGFHPRLSWPGATSRPKPFA